MQLQWQQPTPLKPSSVQLKQQRLMLVLLAQSLPHFVARGVVLIIIGTFLISMQDAVVKVFAEHLSLWQMFVIRGLLTIPLFVLLGWGFNAHKTLFRDAMRPWVLVRGFFIAITLLLFYAALPFSQISTLAAVIYLSPILIVIFSSFLINEPVKLSGGHFCRLQARYYTLLRTLLRGFIAKIYQPQRLACR